MFPDWYVSLSTSSGPAFLPALSNADVAVVAVLAFAIFFVVGIVLQASWPMDASFFSLVAGGILVTWPAMVVMLMATVVLVIVVSLLHKAIWPERRARIDAEGRNVSMPALESFAREAGLSEADRRELLKGDDGKPQ